MKFSVAYISFYDNEMKMSVVECDDILDAPVVAGFAADDERHHWCDNESMSQYFFDGDSAIGVIEI